MKKIIVLKTLGLALFLIGFGLFVSLFFLSDFRLTGSILKEALKDKVSYSYFKESTEPLLNKDYSWNVPFVADLRKAIDEGNAMIRKDYAISEQETAQILSRMEGSGTFNLNTAIETFGQSEPDKWKAKNLKDYASWMDNRTFESPEKLQAQLKSTIEAINKDVVKQKGINKYQKTGTLTNLVKSSTIGTLEKNNSLWLWLIFGLACGGALLYFIPRIKEEPAGIKNNHIFHRAMTNVGWLGILTGTFLIAFYILLYFYPMYLTNWIVLVDPVSYALKGTEAGQFFLYGFLYTLAILVMGVRMMIKYRHSRYHIVRTSSVMFFQLGFAFLIPEILIRLNYPYFDLKNIWPLHYDLFFPSSINNLLESGTVGIFMLGWGIVLAVVGVPVMVYFFGKRWYCSWVCGCGGLAETLGDPYRQLSDKSLGAWKVERWMVHGVLALAIIMTAGMIYTFFTNSSTILGMNTYTLAESYGFLIGAGFAGVVGTGFYPFMGNRVWCRFGCPLAAYLGLVQRFKSRFRITTNGGQCISCGNCSTYCEMGIDVRWYAQRGQNIIRSSCVGCGICSSVCPRGVLKLENASEEGRYGKPILIGNKGVTVKS